MRFICDHDYHLHSGLSLCSDDPKQTPQAILDLSKANGFKKICLTDHYWDETVPKAGPIEFYDVQNTAHIEKALPLPQDDEVEYHFGAEVDMDKNYTIGIGDKMIEKLDFIVVPTTHLHFVGFTIDEKDKARFFTVDELVALNYDFDKCCPFPYEEEEILEPTELIARYQAERTNLNANIDRILTDISAMLGVIES